ncbi:hypothetical protein Tco_0280878 [Tanacetum coccineum]
MGLGIALGPEYEVGESSAAAAARPAGGLRADYGFVAIMDREIRRDPERYVGYGITEFKSMVRRDTDEIYTRLDDEQSQRQLLAGQLNMLFRDRRAHAQVMSLRTTVHAHMSEIRELQSADHSRQREIADLLKTDHGRREEMRELRAADRTRHQQIIQTLTIMQTLQREIIPLRDWSPHCRGRSPAQPELPEEAGSSS